MSFETAWQNIESHLKADAESVQARLEQDLPEVASFISGASSNPVVTALAAAVHLPEAPEVMQTIANLIANVDASLGATKAAAQAQAAAEPSAA